MAKHVTKLVTKTRDKTRNKANFQLNEELNEEIKITKIELGDRKQEVDMLQEEKEDERKEKLQLQQVAVTFNSFFSWRNLKILIIFLLSSVAACFAFSAQEGHSNNRAERQNPLLLYELLSKLA